MRLYNDTIRIVPMEQSHWANIYRWYHSGEYEDFFGNMPAMTTVDAAQFNQEGHNFMIVSKENENEVLGMICLTHLDDRNRNLYFHIMLDKQVQGKKIAKEAGTIILYYALNCMNYFKIKARISAESMITKQFTESYGFEKEGVLKQEIYHNGEFHDVLVYRLTKGPFNKVHKQKLEAMNG